MQGIPVNLALDRGTFFTMKLPLPEETPSWPAVRNAAVCRQP